MATQQFEAAVFEQGGKGVIYPLVGPEPFDLDSLIDYMADWAYYDITVRLWGQTAAGELVLIAEHLGAARPSPLTAAQFAEWPIYL